MSRRFALALVAIVLVQFCSIYAWQRYERNEKLTTITTSLFATHEVAISGQEKLLKVRVREYEALMKDDTKARFEPLLRFVTEHYEVYQSLHNGEDEEACRENAIGFIRTVSADYEAVMTQHEYFDLNQEEAKIKCREMVEFTSNSLTTLTAISHDLHPSLQCGAIRIVTLGYLQEMLFDAMVLCSSKAMIFDQFFPIFNADRCAYQSGDSLHARVSVGSYSNSLDPENVVLTIDGKEYPIGPDGTAKFQTSERKRGQHTLKTRVVVTNPLTGEVQSGEGSFTYEVY